MELPGTRAALTNHGRSTAALTNHGRSTRVDLLDLGLLDRDHLTDVAS
jgi:hypothetical protein